MTENADLTDYLDRLSIGVALVDEDHILIGYNQHFETLLRRVEPFKNESDGGLIGFAGRDFYKALGNPRIETQCYAPFYFAKMEKQTSQTLLSWGGSDTAANEKEPDVYYELSVSNADEKRYLVELRDVTKIVKKERKARLLEEVSRDLLLAVANNRMKTLDEKKELLKKYICEALHDVFNYDVFEIRIVDPSTEERELKYFVGWDKESEKTSCPLKPRWNSNGITGCVAISREYYICDDTRNDSHYKKGFFAARSSMTVPLIVHDMLFGVCNVESEKPCAFTVEDAEFLTSYSRAVALALYFINFLSSEFQNLLFDCGKEVDVRLRAATSSLLERSLELLNLFLKQAPSDDHKDKIERLDALVDDSLELSESIADLKRSFCDNMTQADDLEYASIYEFLKQSRVLVVGNAPWNYVKKLEETGACVDVVSTTSAALRVLERCTYDLVVSERTPDGTFFKPMQRSDKVGASLNSRRLNIYDVHEFGYFEPAEGDPFDAAERRRVKAEIEGGKGDAFFLYQQMRQMEKNSRTLFLLAIDHEYDPTHVQKCLSQVRGNKLQPTFYSDTEILKPVLNAIQKAMDYRAACEAKQTELSSKL